jgi:hypothetical protein
MKMRKRIVSLVLAALIVALYTRLVATNCWVVRSDYDLSPVRWSFVLVLGVVLIVGLLQIVIYDVISHYRFSKGLEQTPDQADWYPEGSDQPLSGEVKFGCLYPVLIFFLLAFDMAWTGAVFCS